MTSWSPHVKIWAEQGLCEKEGPFLPPWYLQNLPDSPGRLFVGCRAIHEA